MNVALFASLTLRELVRRTVVLAVGILTAIIVAFTAWGMERLVHATVAGAPIATPGIRAAAAGIVMMLAFLFSFVIAVGGALIGAPAMAESIANGEIQAVLARPVRRAEIVAGRWIGTLVGLAAYVAVAGGCELGVVALFTGYVPPHPLVALVDLAALGAVVTTAAIALATRLSPIAAGAVAVMLFGLAWIGGVVESIGLALDNARLADAGTVVGLVFPSDALWRGALFALQPAVITAAVAGATAVQTVNPFAVTAPPPPAMMAWAGGWVVVVLGTGMVLFRTRDL